MKKVLSCILILIFAAALALVGFVLLKHKFLSAPQEKPYLSNTEVTHSSNEAELISKSEYEDIVFLQFKIGDIRNCFIQTVTSPFRNTEGLKSYTFTASDISSTTIKRGLSKSISTTESIKLTQSDSSSLSWEISGKNGITEKIGLEMKPLSAGVQKSFEIAAKVGMTNTHATAEEIAQSATESNSSDEQIQTLNQRLLQYTMEYNMSECPKDLFYALCIVANVEIYQVVAYNRADQEFFTTYFYANIPDEIGIQMLTSEDISFGIPEKYQLSPITEISIEMFQDANPERKTIEVDLRNVHTFKEADGKPIDIDISQTSFHHQNYDISSGVFKVYGSEDYFDVDKYIFRGMYGMKDERGNIIKNRIAGFSIEIYSTHDIEIVFENMAFLGAEGKPAIYCNSSVGRNITVTLNSSGLGNVIFGSDGKNSTEDSCAGEDGMPAIQIERLILSGNKYLEIRGGDGGDGVDGIGYDINSYGSANGHGEAGSSGGNGGAAVNCKELTIKEGAQVSLTGGNGGKSGDGGDGKGSKASGNPRAGSGGDGATGANGGSAIKSEILTIEARCSVILYSGDGARGGDGGHGGNAANQDSRDNGGHGGHGGAGGSSGYCLEVDKVNSEVLIICVPGQAGDGGNGGDGGISWQNVNFWEQNYGGDGGNGARGGDCRISKTRTDMISVSGQCNAGEGGRGGIGGDCPENGGYNGGRHGGATGAGGDGGDIINGDKIISGTSGEGQEGGKGARQ